MLSEGGGEDGADALSASQLDAKRSMESGIEATLVTILEPVVGKGRVRASATVELNMARVQKVEETYNPDSAVVRSEQKSKTRRQGGGTGGIPGTASNLPTGTPVAAAGSSTADESQTSTTNYEIDKVVSTIAQPAGQLVRQSVAVVVDNAPAASKDAKPAPRSDEEMRKITDVVRAAAGIDEDRGDLLIVANSPFDETASVAAELQAESADRWHSLIQVARYLALPLAVLLVVFLVIRPAIGALRSVRAPAALGAGAPPTIAELQASLAGGGAPGGGKLRRQLMDAAATDPEAAALVVRGWLDGKG
jgi:flagellar M-ring protein FliF